MIPLLAIIGAICAWLMFRKIPRGKHRYRSQRYEVENPEEQFSGTGNNFEQGGRFYHSGQEPVSINERIRLEKEKKSEEQP